LKSIEEALSVILSILDDIKSETFSRRSRYSNSEEILWKEDFDAKSYEIYLTLVDFEILLRNKFNKHKVNPKFLKLVNSFYVDVLFPHYTQFCCKLEVG
jgi:hypothetical protein